MSFNYRLPQGWRWVTVEDVQSQEKRSTITGPFGSSIGSKFFVDKGIPVIRGNNLKLGSEKFVDDGFVFITEEKAEELKGYKAYSGDLLFTAAGTIGQVGIIPDNCAYEYYIISNKQMRARLDSSKIDAMFAYYWFSSNPMVSYIKALDTGSTIPLINLGILRKLPIPLPPLDEQIKIKRHLVSLDNKIEINRQTNQTLEAIAQTLFKSWFVDFDPVKAKLSVLAAGGSAEEAERAAMCAISARDQASLNTLQTEQPEAYAELARTAALFPSAMQDSELGEIPVGWDIIQNSSVMDVRDGTHDSPKQSQTGFPLVTSKHITSGILAINNAYLISKEDYEKVNKRSKVNQGDILLTMIGTVGIPYLVMQPEVNFAIKNIGLFRTSQNPRLRNYFFLLLKSDNMQSYLQSRMAGTTQKYLSLKTLRSIDIISPSYDLLDAFNSIINPLIDGCFSNSKENDFLKSAMDTLLPKLLSGELTLPNTTPPKANPPESDTLEGQQPQQPLMEAAG